MISASITNQSNYQIICSGFQCMVAAMGAKRSEYYHAMQLGPEAEDKEN